MSKVIIAAIIILTFVSLLALGGVISLGTRLEKGLSIPSAQTYPAATFTPNFFATATPAPLIGGCDSDCQAYVQSQIAKAVATLSAVPKATTVSAPAASSSQSKTKQTTYISLSGSFSTTNTTWTDVAGTEVYIDIENDYGKNTYVTWDATLKTLSGSGTAYARLFDATNGIAVQGSEVMVSSGTFTQASSGQLALWRGRNLYKVQIRSLDSNEITFGSGRIKVVY